jgi:hypothetical protein
MDFKECIPVLLSILGVCSRNIMHTVCRMRRRFLLEKHRSSAEVDFCVVADGKIVPVEVKSGPAGKLKSMHLFLKTYPNSPKGFVFSTQPYAELPDSKITFIPLYSIFSATGGRGEL